MGRVRGLRHRQRLQHIIRPLQVEQAENFNGVHARCHNYTHTIHGVHTRFRSGECDCDRTLCSLPWIASARGILLGNTSHHFHLQLFLDSCAQRKLRHRILGH